MRLLPEELSPGAIANFRRLCLESGYADFVSSFHPAHVWLVGEVLDQAVLAPELNALYRLLGGEEVSRRALSRQAVAVLSELASSGIASVGNWCSLNGLSLSYQAGFPYFHGSAELLDQFYFGEDSVALRQRLAVCSGRALDLCAGPGIQSIALALRGLDVMAVDRSRETLDLLSCNAAFAGVGRTIVTLESEVGQLNSQIGMFDFICANPPLVPVGLSWGYPRVGAGGVDGFRVGREILEVVGRHLAPEGRFQMVGMTTGGGEGGGLLDEIDSWAVSNGLNATLTMLRRFPLGLDSDYIGSLAQTCLRFDRRRAKSPDLRDLVDLTRALDEELTADGSKWVYTFVLSGSRRPKGFFPAGLTTVSLLDCSVGLGSWWL